MANNYYSFQQIQLEKNWMQYILNNNINMINIIVYTTLH